MLHQRVTGLPNQRLVTHRSGGTKRNMKNTTIVKWYDFNNMEIWHSPLKKPFTSNCIQIFYWNSFENLHSHPAYTHPMYIVPCLTLQTWMELYVFHRKKPHWNPFEWKRPTCFLPEDMYIFLLLFLISVLMIFYCMDENQYIIVFLGMEKYRNISGEVKESMIASDHHVHNSMT